MKYTVVDLFAGVGGLSYGFARDDDFTIVAANEILANMAKAYSLNHPSVKMYNKDIKDFSLEDLKSDFGISKSDIDIVVGGPPCQAYSTVGKRLIDDPRGKLFQEYFRVINELKPKIFVFENVKGLLSMQGGHLFNQIICLFESIGYNVTYKLLNAADYGAPQIRERVIIVGTLDNKKFEFPNPTHYNPEEGANLFLELKPYVTLGEAIGDLGELQNGGICKTYASAPQNEYQKLVKNKITETA